MFLHSSFNSHYQRLPMFIKHYVSHIVFKPKLGKNVMLDGNVITGKNVQIQDYSYVVGDSYLSNVTIGKYCCIARNFKTVSSGHSFQEFTNYDLFGHVNSPLVGYTKPNNNRTRIAANSQIIIGCDVWIGDSVTIICAGAGKMIRIGNGAVIGAGSIVTKDVPAFAIVAGNPAKIIKYRFDESKIEYLENLKWWDWNPQKIFDNFDKLCDGANI